MHASHTAQARGFIDRSNAVLVFSHPVYAIHSFVQTNSASLATALFFIALPTDSSFPYEAAVSMRRYPTSMGLTNALLAFHRILDLKNAKPRDWHLDAVIQYKVSHDFPFRLSEAALSPRGD